MTKAEEILEFLPKFHHATDRRKLLYHVVESLATKTHNIENDMIKNMKAHWVEKAEDIDDLEKIASLYGIEREPFESLQEFRVKIRDVIRLYLEGPGTIPSIIEFIAIALRKYNVEIERDEERKAIIHSHGTEEQISRCNIFGSKKDGFIELRENPAYLKQLGKVPVSYGDILSANNRGFIDYYPEIMIHGLDMRTINPIIFNRSSGFLIGYRGVIPDKCVLTITGDKEGLVLSASMDEANAMDRVYSVHGSQFNKERFGDEGVRYAAYDPQPSYDECACNLNVFEEVKNGDVSPIYNVHIPPLPLGESKWEFSIRRARYNNSRYSDDAFAYPDQPIGRYNSNSYNYSIFRPTPSAELELRWNENQRAMFEVIIPSWLGETSADQATLEGRSDRPDELIMRLRKVVEKVKPAGVKAIVRYSDD